MTIHTKKVVTEYLNNWGWDEATVHDLGCFHQWPFNKIFQLSTRINDNMIATYKRMNRFLQKTTSEKARISPEDLTILGRKMFVQFASQPYKVEKIPIAFHGKKMFQKLYIKYDHSIHSSPKWLLYHVIKDEKTGRNINEVLKKADRIEEIAIWLIHNGLYMPATTFQLLPNPTPVTPEDIRLFLDKLYDFFPEHDNDTISPQRLLGDAHVLKLFITVNFTADRKLNKICEYTAIYKTSWGEVFCRVFFEKKGKRTD